MARDELPAARDPGQHHDTREVRRAAAGHHTGALLLDSISIAPIGSKDSSKAGSITGMKVSISLPDDDVAFLDDWAAQAGSTSRSAVIHQAIGLLRDASLEEAYAAAWGDWEGSEDAALWDTTAPDGIVDAAR